MLKIPKFKSLSLKIILLLAIGAISFLLFFIPTVYLLTRSSLFSSTAEKIQAETTLKAEQLSLFIKLIKNDITFISRSSQFTEFIQAQTKEKIQSNESSNNNQLQSRKEELAELFSDEITSKPYYFQIRFLDQNGQEIVRVDNQNNIPVVKNDEELQNKSHRYYFQEILKTKNNEIYLSRIDLNREGAQNQIVEPYQPTIRIAKPIYQDNSFIGALIINMSAQEIIDIVKDKNLITYFLNSDGSFIIHPDTNKQWGSDYDLNHGANLDNEFPDLAQKIREINQGEVGSKDALISFKKIDVLNNIDDQFVLSDTHFIILELIPKSIILSEVNKSINLITIQTIFIVIVILILISVIINKFLSPLNKLVEVTHKVKNKDFSPVITSNSNDEIGILVKNFNSMTKQLKELYQNLETEIDQKTKSLKNKVEQLNEEKNNSKKFLQSVEASSNLIYITNTDGEIIYINPIVKKITGFSVEESLGNKAGNKLWGGLMSQEFYKKLWQTIKNKKTFKGELIGRKKDKTEFIAELTISPVLDDKEEIIYFVAVQDDITNAKRADQIKSEFITVVSHQLRTPLSSTNWMLESLLEDKLTIPQKKTVKEIITNNQRTIELVNDLITISDFEHGKVDYDKEIIEPKKLINKVLEKISIKNKKTTSRCQINIGKNVPKEIKNSPIYLSTVLEILITNAIEYSKPDTNVIINVEKHKKEIQFTVVDQGIGVPNDDKEYIFNKFFRSKNASKIETDRSGLGLYLAKLIINNINGKIGFESKEGKGSSFWFTIKP